MYALIKGCLRARPVVEMHVNAHRLSLGDICYIEQVGHGTVPVQVVSFTEVPHATRYRVRVLMGKHIGRVIGVTTFYSNLVSSFPVPHTQAHVHLQVHV